MSIEQLPNGDLLLACDGDGCTIEMVHPGFTESELLDRAEERGWQVWRKVGLHYCDLTAVNDCAVCGAATRSSVTNVQTGEVTYYCEEHFTP